MALPATLEEACAVIETIREEIFWYVTTKSRVIMADVGKMKRKYLYGN